MKISNDEITYLKLSICDDIGRVFHWRNGIYRGIFPQSVNKVRELFSSGLIDELIQNNIFPQSKITEHTHDEFQLIIEHELVPFVTYPHEWTLNMFRDATRAVLEVGKIANRHGYRLKDCHPYNILFKGLSPFYIDLGSFVKANDGDSILPVPEFLGCYWYPLSIWSNGDYFIAQRIISSEFDLMPTDSWLAYNWPLIKILSVRYRKYISRIWNGVAKRLSRQLMKIKNKKVIGLLKYLPAEFYSNNINILQEKVRQLPTPQIKSSWLDLILPRKCRHTHATFFSQFSS